MVNGLVLQVRTYCAQYNIRTTTTNSSTIGKEKKHSLCHPHFTRHVNQPWCIAPQIRTDVLGPVCIILLSGLREANTAGGPTAVINTAVYWCRGSCEDVRRVWETAETRNRAVKQGCDWGACGRPRRRDLATSLALRDGRGEGGPARGQGPRN